MTSKTTVGGSAVADEKTETAPAETPRSPRFDYLSTSESGLHYVRDRKTGTMRLLTEQELQDFNDPPPCAECGEQFGCEHFNCAGEPMLSEADIETVVPPEWRVLARNEGLSVKDLERLRTIEEHEGEYRNVSNESPDMRSLELVLLLNER